MHRLFYCRDKLPMLGMPEEKIGKDEHMEFRFASRLQMCKEVSWISTPDKALGDNDRILGVVLYGRDMLAFQDILPHVVNKVGVREVSDDDLASTQYSTCKTW